jgi:hypothetical protein
MAINSDPLLTANVGQVGKPLINVVTYLHRR